MSLIYVTGPAGSGKSAVQERLHILGYRAYDEDDPAIGSAHTLQSGEPVRIPPASQRSADWFDRHEWRVYESALVKLKAESADTIVFLFGNALTKYQIEAYVDLVLYLEVNTDTMRKRINQRTDNDYGKTASEFTLIVERMERDHAAISGSITTTIDANRELDAVVAAVLDAIPA